MRNIHQTDVVFKHARLVTMMSGVGSDKRHRLTANGAYLDQLAQRLANAALAAEGGAQASPADVDQRRGSARCWRRCAVVEAAVTVTVVVIVMAAVVEASMRPRILQDAAAGPPNSAINSRRRITVAGMVIASSSIGQLLIRALQHTFPCS